MSSDISYMHRALDLAKLGLNTAHPNPRVGCVLVQGDKVIGEGYHAKTGGPHAEIVALENAGTNAQGATCYVTLEPCAHTGRTGPCIDALIKAKIARCVIASGDPFSKVRGKGISALKAAGIEVELGILKTEAQELNQGFFSRVMKSKPYVTVKVAASLDGKTAMHSGESQWITSSEARQEVHSLRAQSGAIIMGVDTVLQDNPSMMVRDEAVLKTIEIPENFTQPVRVILDTNLRTPTHAKILNQPGKTVVIISNAVDTERQSAWVSALNPSCYAQLISLPVINNRICLPSVLNLLAEWEINDVLIETGQTLVGAFLEQRLVDRLVLFMAPKFLGSDAKGMASLPGISQLKNHIGMQFQSLSQVGPDIKIVATLLKESE